MPVMITEADLTAFLSSCIGSAGKADGIVANLEHLPARSGGGSVIRLTKGDIELTVRDVRSLAFGLKLIQSIYLVCRCI